MVTVEQLMAEYGDTPRMQAYIKTTSLLLDVRNMLQSNSNIILDVHGCILHAVEGEAGYYADNDTIETMDDLHERLKNFPDAPRKTPFLSFEAYMRPETKELRQRNFKDVGDVKRLAFIFSGAKEERKGYTEAGFCFDPKGIDIQIGGWGPGSRVKYGKLFETDLEKVRHSVSTTLQRMMTLLKDKPVLETTKAYLANPNLFMLESKSISPGLWLDEGEGAARVSVTDLTHDKF